MCGFSEIRHRVFIICQLPCGVIRAHNVVGAHDFRCPSSDDEGASNTTLSPIVSSCFFQRYFPRVSWGLPVAIRAREK